MQQYNDEYSPDFGDDNESGHSRRDSTTAARSAVAAPGTSEEAVAAMPSTADEAVASGVVPAAPEAAVVGAVPSGVEASPRAARASTAPAAGNSDFDVPGHMWTSEQFRQHLLYV